MALMTFMLVNGDDAVWIVTYDPASEMRKLYSLYAWLSKMDPALEGDAVGKWLEENGVKIERVYPLDAETMTVNLSDAETMEYTELLDDLRLFG
jgi:hypothetical protein